MTKRIVNRLAEPRELLDHDAPVSAHTHVQANGAEVHYLTSGHGPTRILLLHGWACNSLYWLPVLRRIPADRFAVYAIDLPGFGASTPCNAISFPTFASVAADFLCATEGAGSWVVVGHSMGGSVGLELARSRPDLVKSVLVEGATPDSPHVAPRERRLALLQDVGTAGQWFDDVISSWFEDIGDADLRSLTEIARSVDARVLVDTTRMIMEGLGSYDETPTGVTLKFVAGDRDANRSQSVFQESAARYGAHLTVVPGCGHTPHIERPDCFAEILWGFAGEVDRADGKGHEDVKRLSERCVVNSSISRGN